MAEKTERKKASRHSLAHSSQKALPLLKLIHASRNISRADLARRSGLSAGSVTAMVQNLIQTGLVVENGRAASHRGRKPISLGVRNDTAYVVGVDLGSFFLRVVITDLNGNVRHSLQIETCLTEGRERVVHRMIEAMRKAIVESEVARTAIRGVGVGHSGVIDSEKGLVLSFPRPGQMTEWKNVPLRRIIEKEFDVPCQIEDSVRAIASAEKIFGLGKDLTDFIYIDVGMGIGAGIFLDGKLYRGPGGSAGEFGHVTVDEKGPLCCCGNTGCLETLASCAAIIQAVRTAIERGVDSRVTDLALGDLNRISIEAIVQAAIENDGLAFRVLHEAAFHIAVALADVVNLLNPPALLFGGALFRAAQNLLLDPMNRTIRQRALEKSANEVKLLVSKLGSDAGAIGAARLMSERVLETVFEAK
jgi:glucokinase-like ROK family protein